MEEKQIIDLYFSRSEQAITETDKKYGSYCRQVAYNILCSHPDSEECVNDTYLKTWNVIPPKRPSPLKIFLGKITRNLALDRWDWNHAAKRGGGEVAASLEELGECIPAPQDTEQIVQNKELVRALDTFLEGLPAETRKVFLRRYWNLSPVKEIASFYGLSESKVKMLLMRTRNALKAYLEQEGIFL